MIDVAKAPASPAPRRRFWRVLGASGSVLAGAGFYFSMAEMAAMMDGPGVGLFSSRSTSGPFELIWLTGLGAFAVGAIGARSAGWAGKSFLLAPLTYALLLISGAGGRVYGYAYARRCLAGSSMDCYAAGGSYRFGLLRTSGERERGNEFYLRGCESGASARNSGRASAPLPRRYRGCSNCCRRLLEQSDLALEVRDRACRAMADECRADQTSCPDLQRFDCTGTGTAATKQSSAGSSGPAPDLSGPDAWLVGFNVVPLLLLTAGVVGGMVFRRRPNARLRVWAGSVAGMWLVLLGLVHGRGASPDDLTPLIACRQSTGGLRLAPAASAGSAACTPVQPSFAELHRLRPNGILIGRVADTAEVARWVADSQQPRAGFVAADEAAAVQTTALLVSGSRGLVSHQYRLVDGQIRDARAWPLSPLRPSSWLCWLAAMCLVPLTVRVAMRAWAEARPSLARPWIPPLLMFLAFAALVALVLWRRNQVMGSAEGLFYPYDDAAFRSDVWRVWNEKSIAWPLYQGELAPRAYMIDAVRRELLAAKPSADIVIGMLGLPTWQIPHGDGGETLLYHIGWWQWVDGPFLTVTLGRDGRVEAVGRDWRSSGAKGGYAHGGPYDDGSGFAKVVRRVDAGAASEHQ